MTRQLRQRAHQLKEKWPGYGPLLDFYVAVREAQAASKPRVLVVLAEPATGAAAMPALPRIGDGGFPIDLESSVRLFGDLSRLGKNANPHLAAQAEKIEHDIAQGGLNLAMLLAAAENPGAIDQAAADRGLDARILAFLVRHSIRPSIEAARDQLLAGFEPDSWRRCSCPVCGAPPALSVLKGEPVLRYALCSHCGCDWRVDRVSCAVCGERNPDALQYFHDEGDAACRIDLCDSCRHYIKTIDVRPLEAPDPVLEDLATLHLDVVASEKGYSRAVPNPWTA